MDADAMQFGMKLAGIAPKTKRKRRGRPSRRELWNAALQRCADNGTDFKDDHFLMDRLGRIALGPIDLGPMNVTIGRRVHEICEIALNRSLEQGESDGE